MTTAGSREHELQPLPASARRLDIVGFGEPMVEFSQTDQHATREHGGGPLWLQGFGGDTSNATIAAARQGARTGYITRVGDDDFGRALLDLWSREGVATDGVAVDPTSPTAAYFITHGPSGHSFSYLRKGSAATRISPETLPRETIRAARILHVSGISQAISASAADAVFAAIVEAQSAGTLVSYDSNLRLRLWPLARARAVTMAAMLQADIVLPGLDDARQLTGIEDPDAIADAFLAGRPRIVAMTLGSDGALVATRRSRQRIGSINVDAVDASGAGDCFDGAFLAEWLRNTDPFAAARYACVAAALSTRGKGAVTPIPRRAEVEAALANSPGKP
jgi:2-dehydro-3-deoxygluconokinase